jgi:hypothetical protein
MEKTAMSDFDVFAPTQGAVTPEQRNMLRRQHQAQQDATLAALGSPAGRAWLDAILAREYARPSYIPGDDFASTAYRQGRIAVLREIAEQLHAASQPVPTGE